MHRMAKSYAYGVGYVHRQPTFNFARYHWLWAIHVPRHQWKHFPYEGHSMFHWGLTDRDRGDLEIVLRPWWFCIVFNAHIRYDFDWISVVYQWPKADHSQVGSANLQAPRRNWYQKYPTWRHHVSTRVSPPLCYLPASRPTTGANASTWASGTRNTQSSVLNRRILVH
jgi:hypothetical protein